MPSSSPGDAKKRVLIGGPIWDAPEAVFLNDDNIETIYARDLEGDALQEAIETADGIYVQSPFVLTAEWINAAKRLQIIGTAGSGTNRVDVDAATELGIPVAHAAGTAYRSVAEGAVGLMLNVAKRISWSDRYFHVHKEWPPFVEGGFGHCLWGKTVGIVGLGFIGRDVAHKLGVGFEMRVIAYDPYFLVNEADRLHIELMRDLDQMISESDFLVITCPYNDETRDLIKDRELRLLKPTSYVIISSRGGIVNEKDLVAAMQEGRIAGCGLDTWDPEPAPPNHPLYDMDNAVLTRHTSGGTVEDIPRIGESVAVHIATALRGIRPDHIANPKVWPLGKAQSLRMQNLENSTGGN